MEIIYYLTAISLLSYMILATYDGVYLHLWKYELFDRKESFFEHKTHTARAVLFPLIVWMLWLKSSQLFFILGMLLVILDIIILSIDAYAEKDSRKFMGGLPKWEYIIHLFSNGFHFAIIAMAFGLKLGIAGDNLVFINNATITSGSKFLYIVSINAIPGAVLIAIIHVLLLIRAPRRFWLRKRAEIKCC